MTVDRTNVSSTTDPRLTVPARSRMASIRSALSFGRLSGVYLLIALIIIFSLWIPDVFLTHTNLINIAQSQAITAIITLGLLLPLAAGEFDLAVGQTVTASAVIAAWLMHKGYATTPAVIGAMAAGVGIGVVNASLVVFGKINSFIATLGVSSVLIALVEYITNDVQIIGFPASFTRLGNAQPLGIPITVVYLVVLAAFGWYLLEHTPFGRYLFAIGGGADAARLAGVRVRLYLFLAMMGSSVVAAFAGIVLTARLGAATNDMGTGYLLPAYAAAFLGATMIKRGRFNVIGSVIANYLLMVGVTGLELGGASFWVPDLFNGVALIVAVGVSGFEARYRLSRARKAAAAAARTDDTVASEGAVV
jgi:ribose transport system permease protein